MKVIAQNKKVFFDYEIIDRIEAGIVLTGSEVKSLRAGNVSLIGAFATVHDGQMFLINCNIAPFAQAYMPKKDEATRSRKLLLKRKEINRLIGDISRKGITIVPLRLYFNDKNLLKVELGLAKHKNAANKKASIKERDIKRETSRELRGKYNF